jgi:Zn-dependent protease
MGGAFKIGRFSGIDVRVHWTFFLLLVFFAFIGYQASGGPVGALTATVTIVALFFCVLLHEFGHSLVAQRLGLEIHSITLLPLGGVSNLESLPEKPADEVKIILAGPLVNVVLAPIFFGVGLLFGAVPPDIPLCVLGLFALLSIIGLSFCHFPNPYYRKDTQQHPALSKQLITGCRCSHCPHFLNVSIGCQVWLLHPSPPNPYLFP